MHARGWVGTLLLIGLLGVTTGCGGSEARKARHVEDGREFMAERNYTKARLEFRNALQIDPKDGEVRALVGLSNEKLKEYKDAVNAYLLALQIDDTLEMPRARVAMIYAGAGLTDEAMELITPGLARNPKSAALLTARAVATAQDDPAAARRDAEEAVRLDLGNEDAPGVLASLMWRVDERNEAIAVLEKAVAAMPQSMDLRTNLAQLLLTEGRVAEAEKHLLEVERLDPGQIEHSFRLAQAYLVQGKVDPALKTVRAAVAAHPDNVDAKLALAQLLVEQRSFEDGEKELLAFAAAERKDLELQLGLGRFYEANRRAGEAAGVYRSIIEASGSRAQGLTARNRLAAISLADGRLDEAGELAGAVLKENPRDGEALVLRADIAMRRAEPASAIADLRTALSDQPDSVPLAMGLARAYVQSGQADLAEQVLRSMVQANPRDVQARFALAQYLIETGRASQAQPVLEQLVAEQPGNVVALAGLASVQLTAGDYKAALRTASIVQALEPKSGRGYQLQGTALQSDRNLSDARIAFQRAADLDPRSAEPIVLLAQLDLIEKQPEKALARLNQAENSLPKSPLIMGARGDVLTSMGRHKEAIENYRAAIVALPTWPQLYRALAGAYENIDDPKGALEVLREGFDATRASAAIGLPLALSYERAGRVDDAIATYERLLQARPNDYVAANNLAMLLVNTRDDAASLERAERLVAPLSSSEDPGFLDTYGWVLTKRGRPAEAVEYLSKAVKKAPRAAELRFHLGMAQIKAGQAAEGQGNLEAALALQSDFPGADVARAALAEM